MKEEVKLPFVNKMSTAGSVAVFVLSCNCVYGISTILTGSNGVAFKGRSFTLTCEVISGDLDAVVFMNNDNIIASVSYTNGECKHRETSYICVPGTCSCNGKNRYTWTVLSVLGSWHNTTLNCDSIYGGVRSNIYTLYVSEHKKMAKTLETCRFCFENVPKHLIIAIGMKVYLCLPNHRSLTEGHCLIVPMQHVAAGTAVDEDVWNEIQVFRKGLIKMFQDRDEDVVFMETSMKLKYFPYMHIECVPMPKETGDLAPIYFKKAIQESESEWSDNKKLVDLSQKDIRSSVPKGFPYFSVDFGLQGGFAHVIEDEQKCPSYFGREIVGGMIDAEPGFWRKPKKENFDDQRKKVLQFAEWWKAYDWTNRLEGT